jgi:hypothetical protein
MVAGDAIEEILVRHRADLDEAAKALVKAANRGGGDDNITAVLFEVVAGEATPEPDERTKEMAVAADEEDTLHPEDNVPPPPAREDAPSPVDTMVVPAADIDAGLATEEPEAPQAGFGRRLLALLVILALVAIIVVLVWWGLAR